MNWKIIKTGKDYQKALGRLEKTVDSKKGDKDFDEAALLVLLIERYETETEPSFRSPDPIQGIKYKMDIQHLKNKDPRVLLGSKSNASELLNRKRKLTLEMIRTIHKKLKIPAELLIGEYELAN